MVGVMLLIELATFFAGFAVRRAFPPDNREIVLCTVVIYAAAAFLYHA